MANIILRNPLALNCLDEWPAVSEFEKLVNKMFKDIYYSDGGKCCVPIELKDKGDELCFKAVIPGLNKDDINIEVSEDTVKVSGERKESKEEENGSVYSSEFFSGKFERVVPLPSAVDKNNVKADYKDGVLTMNLPKEEKERNKTVKIKL